MSVKRKLHLTAQERQMYKSERLDNFRWIARIVASYSNVQLKDTDRVPPELCQELSDIGQSDFCQDPDFKSPPDTHK
jgi:hypothetical protein